MWVFSVVVVVVVVEETDLLLFCIGATFFFRHTPWPFLDFFKMAKAEATDCAS